MVGFLYAIGSRLAVVSRHNSDEMTMETRLYIAMLLHASASGMTLYSDVEVSKPSAPLLAGSTTEHCMATTFQSKSRAAMGRRH